MGLKVLEKGKKINKKFVLTQVPEGSIVIPAKKVKLLETLEKKEKIKLK